MGEWRLAPRILKLGSRWSRVVISHSFVSSFNNSSELRRL